MTRITSTTFLIVVAITAMNGCCTPPSNQTKVCPPYVSQRSDIPFTTEIADAGITANFSNVPRYQNSRPSRFDPVDPESVVSIDLKEVMCRAARNSDLADLLESERHALACQSVNGQSVNGQNTAVDIILRGEILEQRNKAAGMAAELFLGLVQIDLQRDLLEESKSHQTQLEATIHRAQQAGLATSDGRDALAKSHIQLMTAESELNIAKQKLMFQLNALILVDPESRFVFQPVHQLEPQLLELDTRQESDLATLNRPGIQAIELAIAKAPGAGAINQLASLLDPRLGIRLAPPTLKSRLIRRKFIEKLKLENARDSGSETRKGQIEQVLATRKKQARVEATHALLAIQGSFERLAIANENIDRIMAERVKLNAQKELDARTAFLALNQNWIERQQAKSDRIATAIEYETAILKLLQAQGILVQQCGFDSVSGYSDSAVCCPPTSR